MIRQGDLQFQSLIVEFRAAATVWMHPPEFSKLIVLKASFWGANAMTPATQMV
jgi:hypothetical protein